MGFQYRKRIKIGGGLGLNVGKKGASISYQGKGGSISKRGVSVRTGVPGLSYQSRGKGCMVGIIIFLSFSALGMAACS